MSDEPESLVLRYLRKLDEKADRTAADMHEVKQRLGALEEGQASLSRRLVGLEEGQASLSRRLDRLDERVARIERRLDLVEESPL